MATRLFLRDAAPANDPGTAELSAALPVGTFLDMAFPPKSLSTTKGTAQTSIGANGLSQTAHQDNFFTSFSSAALDAQTIAANTWTLGLATSEANTNANSFTICSIYVFREPSTVVGYIYDSDTALGVEWATTEDGQVLTVSGAAVTAAAGDYIVFEMWRHATQAMAAFYLQTLYYDGTTDVTDATTADAASYIETPQNLVFQAAASTPVIQPVIVRPDPGSFTLRDVLRARPRYLEFPYFEQPPPAPANPVIPIILPNWRHWDWPERRSHAWHAAKDQRPRYFQLVVFNPPFSDYEAFRQFDATQYTPAATVFFEIIMKADPGKTAEARVFNITDGVEVSGSSLSTTSTTFVRLRSGALTLSGAKEYKAQIRLLGGESVMYAGLVGQQ